jgi:hypothetical protein
MRKSTTKHLYDLLPSSENGSKIITQYRSSASQSPKLFKTTTIFLITCSLVISSIVLLAVSDTSLKRTSCDGIYQGYECQPEISHYWGQYSPYFSVPSEIPADIPNGCQVTFVQVLSRHGARGPTAFRTTWYNKTIQQIQKNVKSFTGDYTFLQEYVYTLGADQLTTFGEQEMVNSGIKFYNRYECLTKQFSPFLRSSSQTRVVESAQNFSQGYHQALLADRNATAKDTYPYPITVIGEGNGSNNTLNHGLCTEFENGTDSHIADDAQAKWRAIFTPPITTRLNHNLRGANLSPAQTIYMMDLCPFNTVASETGAISPFCALFTVDEWHQFDYYQSLGKYYGFGNGNALGPTQGVGFANELIARLTNKPVVDHTSTNHTLDSSNSTFPIGPGHVLFADFSHDNDLTTIFSALGLYNATAPLSNTSIETTAQTAGYSASWTVPFAARAYFEKMTCRGMKEELVRVIVNDRVIPLQTCGADQLGRCTLDKFVESLTFAMEGGKWDQCFV